jgi:hypothetical protein
LINIRKYLEKQVIKSKLVGTGIENSDLMNIDLIKIFLSFYLNDFEIFNYEDLPIIKNIYAKDKENLFEFWFAAI